MEICIFFSKCSTIISLLKEYFPLLFSYAELFGYDNSPNESIVKFLAKFEVISPSPQNKKRGEESNHGTLKLHHTSNDSKRTVCSLFLE